MVGERRVRRGGRRTGRWGKVNSKVRGVYCMGEAERRAAGKREETD